MIDIRNQAYQPTLEEISQFVRIPLFDEICCHMEQEYHALWSIEYSKDTYAMGWNVKFRKSGKGLCVVYPHEGYLTVLVVVGKKEKEAVEALLPELSSQVRELYHAAREGNHQRWLMIDAEDHDQVYQDILRLIRIRRISK